MAKRLGIYIHIPFCASKCGYCDFYSLAGCDRLMPDYLSALVSHIAESADSIKSYEIDSVYFGGGTPSYFGAKRIVRILDELKRPGNLRLDAEITVEMNPDSVTPEDLKLLRKAGVNRISLGMQSADNDLLKIIGRRHNFRQVEEAVRMARAAGFDNVSLDLIYGLPNQNKDDWAETLAKAAGLRPEHISCYALTLEPGTPMFEEYSGSAVLPGEDEMADMYLYAVEMLREHHYRQYEISNFAAKGFESKHNMKYWTLQDYMGFGPGAHSCIGGLRYSYIRGLREYIDGIRGKTDIIDEYEKVIPVQKAAEYLMLGMRTVKGVSKEGYERVYKSSWDPIDEVFRVFAKNGWALRSRKDDSWHLTPKGMLISNVLINAVIEAQTGVKVEANPWLQGAFAAMEKSELPPGEDEEFIRQYIHTD